MPQPLHLSIRTKSLLATAALFGLLWGALFGALAWWARGETAAYERDEAVRAVTRVSAILRQETDALRGTAGDWGHWDATYDFILAPNQTYRDENLTASTLGSLRLDFMAFYDVQGRLVHETMGGSAHVRPLDHATLAALEQCDALATAQNSQSGVAGILSTPEGPVLIAAEPVTRSDGSGRGGLLVVGRAFDRTTARRLSQMATLPAYIYSVRENDLPGDVAVHAMHATTSPVHTLTSGDDVLVSYSTMSDIDGDPTILLRTQQPRPINEAVLDVGRQLLGILMFFSVCMVVAVAFLNERLVFRRLTALSSSLIGIGREGDPSARVPVKGHDEISQVALSVNTMLSDLEGSQHDLTYLASHDSLTRLYNRRRFESEVAAKLADDGHGALLWLDLDHFKELNDSLGHAAGDELLKQFSDMLVEHVRGTSLVARLGGDEFGVLMPEISQADALNVAHRLLAELGATVFRVSAHEIRISVSIGVVMYPEHGRALDDLLAKADLAMYHSKAEGRNHVSVYTSDDEWRTEMSERMAMSEQIVRAIRTGRLNLVAQPIVDVRSGDVAAYELLLRVYDEKGDLLMPADVIPTAERLGLIRDIDRWVIRRGIAMLALEDAAGRHTRLHLNLSGSAFSDSGILDYISEELSLSGTDPTRLTIEITETSAINDIGFARTFIQQLQAFGCRFALDDFGSGASSLYYLKHLPVDCLKIDGSIIRDLDSEAPDMHFVRAIVEMCKGMEITTVAEYVEDGFVYALISELGVDQAQGYAIARPDDLEVFTHDASRITLRPGA